MMGFALGFGDQIREAVVDHAEWHSGRRPLHSTRTA